MSQHHCFMQKEGKDGKGEGEIVRADLNKWPQLRQQGYIFLEKTEDFDPAAEFAAQENAKKGGDKKKASKKKAKKKTS